MVYVVTVRKEDGTLGRRIRCKREKTAIEIADTFRKIFGTEVTITAKERRK